MHRLLIRHIDGSHPPQYQVVRLPDGKGTAGVIVPSPMAYPVEGMPDTNLLRELRWYLEQFLEYPFSPETEHAERVLKALNSWGTEAFVALFGGMQGRDWFRDATRNGHEQLILQVSSNDPSILCWPWEALRDPETNTLALGCHIERKLNQVTDPVLLSGALPRERVNILLVTARPYEHDVAYRSISRPLVELIESQRLPARVTLLRPPTFDQLRSYLREHLDTYHILHFDGHGGYGNAARTAATHSFQGPLGQLVFEKEDGTPDLITADVLGALLREHRIPAVVLNACQSAMIDEQAEDAFASVASSLMRTGIRSVVAMSYSLYVSGAQEFLPAFYRRLFESGSAQEAVRAGRQQMFRQQERICARGTYPLQDWLVPVVYAQEELDFCFAAQAKPAPAKNDHSDLPEEARDAKNPYGFIGRDGALLALERAMRRPPAGILIHGLGGAGKTTLARGFIRWRRQTEGPEEGCFWFSFNEINSAESVFNQMGEALFGGNFNPLPLEQKEELLANAFRERPFLIVWDNFESVRGIEGTEVSGRLSAEDQQLLRRFLERLRGEATKVLITSRSEEEWLGNTNRFKVALGGLQAEERWEFCRIILEDLGKRIDLSDPQLVELMNALEGHPLMMRVVLPHMEKRSAAFLLAALRENLEALGIEGDETGRKLQATLRFATESLPDELRPLLVLIAMHERFVHADFLEAMAKQVAGGWDRRQIDTLLSMLTQAGLAREVRTAVFELHPALTGYLRKTVEGQDTTAHEAWARVFVEVMGSLAGQSAPRPLHEQREVFHFYHANFHRALEKAEKLRMERPAAALIHGLAAYAQNTWCLRGAEALFQRLAEHARRWGNEEGEAAAYHQLGTIAQEQQDFEAAEAWYQKSLAISETHGFEHGAASNYHQLGRIALERRDFEAAEAWCQKSLAIKEKHGDEPGTAMTYHQLGMIAQEMQDIKAAEAWYKKSLAVSEKHGNEHHAAPTYHQLGLIAQDRHDFDAAEVWYLKSLAIEEKHGNELGAAGSYHQLGMIAQELQDFEVAEAWYKKSLAISEKLGIEHGAAMTYHLLGMITQKLQDFEATEAWYKKSLAISEKHGNDHHAAITCHQLGRIALERLDFEAAEAWYKKSLAIKVKQGDEHGAADTLAQLGIVAEFREEYMNGARLMIISIQKYLRQNDEFGAKTVSENLLLLLNRAPEAERVGIRALWKEAGLGELPSE